MKYLNLSLFVIIGLLFLSCTEPVDTNNTGVNANPGSGKGMWFYTSNNNGTTADMTYYYAADGSKMMAASTDSATNNIEGSYVYMFEPFDATYFELTLEPGDATNHYKAKFTYKSDGKVIKDVDGVLRIEIGDTPKDGVVGILELGYTKDNAGAEWEGAYDYFEVLNGDFPDPNK